MNVTTAQEFFTKQASIFTGDIESMDIDSWMDEMAEWEKGLFDQLSPFLTKILLKTKLGSKAAKSVETSVIKTPENLYTSLLKSFPVHGYKNKLIVKLLGGLCFKQHTATNCSEEAMRIYNLLGSSDSSAPAVATALSKAFPITWAFTGMSPSQVMKSNFEVTLEKFKDDPSAMLALSPQTQEVRRQVPRAPEQRSIVPHTQNTQNPPRYALRKKKNRDYAAKNQDLERQIEAPGHWTSLVVIDFETEWDILVGSKMLDAMGILLQSTAVGKKHKTQATYKVAAESGDETSSVTDMQHKHPVVQRKILVSQGLPKGYFTPQQDNEFKKYDSMYPDVDRESIVARLTTHCDDETNKRLLEAIISYRAALREYPSGCPPPAAYAPIIPPMKKDAQLLFVA
ncbi:hypothetical protein BDF14DRAFT_1767512 [Spinellus fusiger]|nr:hypothetical protein BDF14DRAFT_1767512 [Spinellus fusiger]